MRDKNYCCSRYNSDLIFFFVFTTSSCKKCDDGVTGVKRLSDKELTSSIPTLVLSHLSSRCASDVMVDALAGDGTNAVEVSEHGLPQSQRM